MKHLSKDHLFPLIMAGNNLTEVMPWYNTVVDQLQELETQCRQRDAGFDISNMWTVTCTNGKLFFDITNRCADHTLKNKMRAIFGVPAVF